MRPRPRAWPLVGVVAGLALVAAACGGGESSGLVTVKDPNLYSLFEVPSDWQVYSDEDVSVENVPFVAQGQDFALPVISQVAFDGSGVHDPGNLAQSISTAAFPIGSSVVRTITDEQKDLMSRFLLAELVVPYHSQASSQELLKVDFEFENEFEGVQLAVAYTDSVTEDDAAVYLISVTDPDVTRMYSIAVGCSLDCFNRHQEEILAVVDSWLVNTRG